MSTPNNNTPKSTTIETLARVLVENDLSEVEYEEGGKRIYLSRAPKALAGIPEVPTPIQVVAPAAPQAVAAKEPEPAAKDLTQHPGVVRAPMVGTAYVAPEEGARPFVLVGDTVTPGQTILIIEAMKVLNPIKATKAGKVIEIFVFDQKPVEYDEPLLVIE